MDHITCDHCGQWLRHQDEAIAFVDDDGASLVLCVLCEVTLLKSATERKRQLLAQVEADGYLLAGLDAPREAH